MWKLITSRWLISDLYSRLLENNLKYLQKANCNKLLEINSLSPLRVITNGAHPLSVTVF